MYNTNTPIKKRRKRIGADKRLKNYIEGWKQRNFDQSVGLDVGNNVQNGYTSGRTGLRILPFENTI